MSTPLKSIVASFLSSADMSEHQFMRVWHIAVRVVREMNLDVYGSFKTKLLYVNDNKTVDLPQDYLNYSKIGILNDFGEVLTLKRNDSMSELHEQYVAELGSVQKVPVVDGAIALNSPTRFPFIWFNYWGAYNYGYHLYGLAGGTSTIGSYKLDETERVIYLSEDWPYQTIMLEYLSSGYDDECGDYMVPLKAEEAVMSGIRWRNAQDLRKKYTNSDVEYYRKEFYNQRRLSKLRLNQATISEMQNVFRSHVKMVAKA